MPNLIAPHAFEVPSIAAVKAEIFGPVPWWVCSPSAAKASPAPDPKPVARTTCTASVPSKP
jgi:hypothetical protein